MLGLNTIDGDYIPSNLDNDCFEVNTNWKDALISNLYSTVEFLKSEIKDKNILITTLINAQVCGNEYVIVLPDHVLIVQIVTYLK